MQLILAKFRFPFYRKLFIEIRKLKFYFKQTSKDISFVTVLFETFCSEIHRRFRVKVIRMRVANLHARFQIKIDTFKHFFNNKKYL